MKALLAALLLGVALGAGATAWLGRPDPALRARADSLAAAHAVADALRDARATAERDTVWLVRRAAGARLAALETAASIEIPLWDSMPQAYSLQLTAASLQLWWFLPRRSTIVHALPNKHR